MHISELLTPERILCNAEVSSKKRALEVMSEIFFRQSIDLSSQKILSSLVNRERLGSTGLGKGVAIPHARIPQIEKPMGALLKLKEGIDYDTIDQQPVDILFALLVPEHYTDEHLQILAGLAELFSTDSLCDNIRNEVSAERLYALLKEWQPGSKE